MEDGRFILRHIPLHASEMTTPFRLRLDTLKDHRKHESLLRTGTTILSFCQSPRPNKAILPHNQL
jgi:hypothetical protein